jgi:hypothetical protein
MMRREKVLARQARALAKYKRLRDNQQFWAASHHAGKERNRAHRAGLTELAEVWEARRPAYIWSKTMQSEVQAKLQAQVARNRRNRELSDRETRE